MRHHGTCSRHRSTVTARSGSLRSWPPQNLRKGSRPRCSRPRSASVGDGVELMPWRPRIAREWVDRGGGRGRHRVPVSRRGPTSLALDRKADLTTVGGRAMAGVMAVRAMGAQRHRARLVGPRRPPPGKARGGPSGQARRGRTFAARGPACPHRGLGSAGHVSGGQARLVCAPARQRFGRSDAVASVTALSSCRAAADRPRGSTGGGGRGRRRVTATTDVGRARSHGRRHDRGRRGDGRRHGGARPGSAGGLRGARRSKRAAAGQAGGGRTASSPRPARWGA
jgi:hypothetical protein